MNLEMQIHEGIRMIFELSAEQTCKEISGLLESASISLEEEVVEEGKPEKATNKSTEDTRILTVCKILRSFGCNPLLKGYKVLACAILLCYDDESMLHRITRGLYPEVAKKFDTTPSRVERAMRHAIATMYPTMKARIVNEGFGELIAQRDKPPTNAQFLVAMIDYFYEHRGLLSGPEQV